MKPIIAISDCGIKIYKSILECANSLNVDRHTVRNALDSSTGEIKSINVCVDYYIGGRVIPECCRRCDKWQLS